MKRIVCSLTLWSFLFAFIVGSSVHAEFHNGADIRASDINALRATVNSKRVGCGLGEATWTDQPLSPGVAIKRVHIGELRSAVSDAYTSESSAPPTFTDPVVVSGTPIRAVHFLEIAASVDALTCVPVVTGTCGPADAQTFTSASLANAAGLCSAGTAVPSALLDPGPWSWNCNGTTNASCSATMTVVTCPLGTSVGGAGGPATPGCRCDLALFSYSGGACYAPCPSGCYASGAHLPGFIVPVGKSETWLTTHYPDYATANASFNCSYASNHNCMSCLSGGVVTWIRGTLSPAFCP